MRATGRTFFVVDICKETKMKKKVFARKKSFLVTCLDDDNVLAFVAKKLSISFQLLFKSKKREMFLN
jgi:hypothetical protein